MQKILRNQNRKKNHINRALNKCQQNAQEKYIFKYKRFSLLEYKYVIYACIYC